MKLPKESTLWKWVIIGLGLIIGVAIIAIMNLLNDMLNSKYGDLSILFETGSVYSSELIVYLAGKIISIFSGSLTAGAIITFLRPEIDVRSLIITGSIFAMLSLFDLFISTFPVWYQITTLITPIPSVIIGSWLINKSLKS